LLVILRAAEESASAHYIVILSAVWRARAKRSRRTCGCSFCAVILSAAKNPRISSLLVFPCLSFRSAAKESASALLARQPDRSAKRAAKNPRISLLLLSLPVSFLFVIPVGNLLLLLRFVILAKPESLYFVFACSCLSFCP